MEGCGGIFVRFGVGGITFVDWGGGFAALMGDMPNFCPFSSEMNIKKRVTVMLHA